MVDSTGQLGRLFDFDVVPNGLFVDDQGTPRLIDIGGFDIRRPEVGPQVDALLESDSSAEAQPRHLLNQEVLEVEVLRLELASDPARAARLCWYRAMPWTKMRLASRNAVRRACEVGQGVGELDEQLLEVVQLLGT